VPTNTTSQFGAVAPNVQAVMRGNAKAETSPERRLRVALAGLGYQFESNHPLSLAGRTTRVDVLFTRERLAVFVDGCFWHRCPTHGTDPRTNSVYWGTKLARNVARDRADDERLQANGWQVLRFWEHVTASDAAAEIVAALEPDAEGTGAHA
jgi:DNA mismatch endonuclease (patch repair protein)